MAYLLLTKKRTLIIPILILLNSLWLFLYYFSNHPSLPLHLHLHLHHHQHNDHHDHQNRHFFSAFSKPWPILPSYLPWSSTSDVRVGSCEGFFGNGFTKTVNVVKRSISPRRQLGSKGWFRCHYSATLRSSICEGGRVRMNPERIRMSIGGERIDDVIGRKDEEELPVFDARAFEIERSGEVGRQKRVLPAEMFEELLPEGEILRHTMRELVGSMEFVDESEFKCSEWIEEPTLLVTRFEYANVFHTYTDWYSAYVSSRVTGLPTRPRVVFVDGHSKTQLEETWKALFSGFRFAENFTGPVCFRHAILSPLGYETAWFKGLTQSIDCHGASARDLWANPDDKKTARLSEFGEMIRSSFGLPVSRPRTPKPSSEFNVLFVRREDYLAHPRHKGKVESRLSNEQEVFDSLKNWASNHSECRVNLVNGLFAHMPMKEQVRAIQDASVIIGAHGAGLTHMVAASPKTVILEIISSEYRRPHFQLISQWKGLEYHAINLVGSYAEPDEVVSRLTQIMKSIGC